MIQILDKTKKKKVIEIISKFGIQKIPYLLLRTGKERIRIYSGSLSNEEIIKIQNLLPIEGIGLYFGKEIDNQIRLNIDAIHVLKDQISDFIVELNTFQETDWLHGRDIILDAEQQEKYKSFKGFVIVKTGEDFVGTGKISTDRKIVFSFLSKARRIKSN
ncbi:MAG: hypothetical protein ACOYT4_04995 [Nanoarchaeota archaeon]